MTLVFEPRKAIYIPTTGGHPKNSEYRVAWGVEQWDHPKNVTKTQMVYKGRVNGMLSPSFPDDTFDELAVQFASKLIKQGYGTDSKKSKDVLVLKEVPSVDDFEYVIDQLEDELQDMNQTIFHKENHALSPVVVSEFRKQFEVKDNIYAFLFRVEIS
ncbi:hypothetical protein O0R52_16000 [Bacillus halotolerans]|uniref:Uncharacterized protein n=1 Tax=Bacillus halotolerans TaxID=260554 RepID=A0ABY7HXQ3_9BACI|nr:hypothetical protein [Bacillus halotolerans]MDG0765222.1 hypothetical protein [Bacillus halotolerans]WAT20452.1 hypothetical protein O0R52_16000 [Bacillus halotolerans]